MRESDGGKWRESSGRNTGAWITYTVKEPIRPGICVLENAYNLVASESTTIGASEDEPQPQASKIVQLFLKLYGYFQLHSDLNQHSEPLDFWAASIVRESK
jgi:hypothetical protein